jgi:hypothetical protein
MQLITAPGRYLSSVFAGLVAAALMGARLLLPVPVGLANNGDGGRLMCQLGAAANGPPAGTAQWLYVRFWYPPVGADDFCGPYRTTQLLQLRLTAKLHSVLGSPGVLDMRLVIIEDCLLTGIALGTLAWLLRRMRLALRVALLVAVFAVLADSTFADYAASPYSEPAAFIGLTGLSLAVVASVAGRRRGTAFVVAVAAAALAVAAKPNTATLALPLAALLGVQRLELGRLRGRLRSRLLPALGAGVVLVAAFWVTSAEADWYEQVNVSNVITKTIMPQSPDPAVVATDLGLPASFGRYSGRDWWSPEPIHADPQYPSHQHLISRQHLAHYLLAHPGTATGMVTGAADDYFAYRASYLGTYSLESGAAAGAQECRLCLLPLLSHLIAPGGFPLLVVLWAAIGAAAVLLIRRSAAHSARRGFAQVALAFIACTVIQYVTAVFGDGVETTKHLVVGLFTAALAAIWLLAAAGVDRADNGARDHDAGGARRDQISGSAWPAGGDGSDSGLGRGAGVHV